MGRGASAWLLPPRGTSGVQQGRSRRDGTRTSRGRVARFTVDRRRWRAGRCRWRRRRRRRPDPAARARWGPRQGGRETPPTWLHVRGEHRGAELAGDVDAGRGCARRRVEVSGGQLDAGVARGGVDRPGASRQRCSPPGRPRAVDIHGRGNAGHDERVTNRVAGYDRQAGENPGQSSPRLPVTRNVPTAQQRPRNEADSEGRPIGTRSDGTRAFVLYGAERRKGVAVGTRAIAGPTGLTVELGTSGRGARRGVLDVVRSTLIGT